MFRISLVLPLALVAISLPACGKAVSPEILCGDDGSCPNDLLCDRGQCVERPDGEYCGDGIVNLAEACDDGNATGGDSCSADCSAPTCVHPTTHSTIAELVADPECSTGFIAEGTTVTEQVVLATDTRLIGIGAKPTLDGDMSGSVVTVLSGATVELENLIVTRGRAAQGGGIHNSGELTLRNVDVVANTAVGVSEGSSGIESGVRGAGILHSGGSLTLVASHIDRNVARPLLQGPRSSVVEGVGIASNGNLTLSEASSVSENTVNINIDSEAGASSATIRGVGIFASAVTVALGEGTIVAGNLGNFTNLEGSGAGTMSAGGVHINGGTLTCTGCSVDDNRISVNATFTAPPAIGGGIVLSGATFTCIGGSISSNSVTTTGNNNGGRSAGIHSSQSNIDLTNCDVTSNVVDSTASSGGSPVARGGGIQVSSGGALVITTSVIADNQVRGSEQAYTAGGGIDVSAGTNPTSVEVNSSAIRGNSADGRTAQGGGIHISGASGAITISLSSAEVSQNTANGSTQAQGGGLYIFSAGPVTAAIVNSTFSSNTSSSEGGGLLAFKADGMPAGQLDLKVSFSTFADNSVGGGFGGGFHVHSDSAATKFEFDHVVSDSNLAGVGLDCFTASAATIEGTNNLINSAANCSFTAVGNNTSATSANLGPLADNGGGTQTHAISSGSAATNGGQAQCTDLSGQPVVVDQRGLPRPNESCDIGSFELQ